jgi:addiction module RelE/StbE family toxin
MEKLLRRHRQFERNFGKRIAKDAKLVAKFEDRLAMFVRGVRGAPINDHPLTGHLSGRRAFSVTADIRVVYVETETAILFVDIGTHNQVYGQ